MIIEKPILHYSIILASFCISWLFLNLIGMSVEFYVWLILEFAIIIRDMLLTSLQIKLGVLVPTDEEPKEDGNTTGL